jgi:hypothetical protein
LLRVLSYQQHGSTFVVTPAGYEVYNEYRKEAGEASEQVEEHTRSYVNSEQFRSRYPNAHRLWADAAERLWGAESQDSLTGIGHTLREAIQAFAGELLTARGLEADGDVAKTLDRVSAVVNAKRAEVGDTAGDLLDAAFGYWRALNSVVQRQIHSQSLTWEDARLSVFHAMFVMTELDRLLLP